MGFIKEVKKFDTGRAMKSLYDNAINSINQVKQNKQALLAQISSMKENEDFTEEDWKEVQEMVDTMNTRIKEL